MEFEFESAGPRNARGDFLSLPLSRPAVSAAAGIGTENATFYLFLEFHVASEEVAFELPTERNDSPLNPVSILGVLT
jgi:hypothetical protein